MATFHKNLKTYFFNLNLLCVHVHDIMFNDSSLTFLYLCAQVPEDIKSYYCYNN